MRGEIERGEKRDETRRKARGPTIGKQHCWWSAAAVAAGDAKVPFEDSYFPESHSCHTRPPAILRLSLHCGNHNYTCGCLLIAARSLDRSLSGPPPPSFEDPCPLFVQLSVALTSKARKSRSRREQRRASTIPIREILKR